MNKYKIVSDGTIEGTTVLDLETNTYVSHITEINIFLSINEPFPIITVTRLGTDIDIDVETESINFIDRNKKDA